MGRIIDRTGEKNINNFGSEMVIVGYRGALDIDVYFPQYNWIARGVQYSHFKSGSIKCPYDKIVFGVGYIGNGKHKVCDKNGKITKCYRTWHDMLKRCYDEKFHEKCPTYKDCEVSEEFHNFQNFSYWYMDNYYEIEGENMCLDKDILWKGNKVYSPDTCIYVPERINTLFIKCDKTRREYPIGVCHDKRPRKFITHCRIYDFKKNKSKKIHLGYYDTQEKAFEAYKQFKEQYIKEVADYYKDKIPKKLYDAMCNYEVDIND